MVLKRDKRLIENLYRVAETFERDGLGRYSPSLLRDAAERIHELSARKQLLASAVRDYRADPSPPR